MISPYAGHIVLRKSNTSKYGSGIDDEICRFETVEAKARQNIHKSVRHRLTMIVQPQTPKP